MACCNKESATEIIDNVKEYYGKTIKKSEDLSTNACVLGKTSIPKHVRQAMALINEEVSSKYYGCGLIAPESLEGAHILDLGSGSGQDCFVLAKLVGQSGHVTGLDMTDEQLEVAVRNIQYHTEKFGYTKPNVNFVRGYMEKLKEAGLKDNSFDIIVSNCVINLSPDKNAVLAEAYRVLKEGGELYFSDVYADCELSEEIRKHKELWGECISGALYWVALCDLAAKLGFSQPRLVSASSMEIGNDELQKVVGDAKFVSATYRLFKLPKESKEFGRDVTYNGGIMGSEEVFKLDHHLSFSKGQPVSVDKEVSTFLSSSRYKRHFTFGPRTQSESQRGQPSQKQNEMDPFLLARSGTPVVIEGSCGAKP